MSTAGKPSREQFEEYYKNSRKYFDEMAEHYKKSDPEYYNSVIAPIIRSHGHTDDGGARKANVSIILTAFLALMVLGIAMLVFFILTPQEREINPVDMKLKEIEQDRNTNTRSPLRETNPDKPDDQTDESTEVNDMTTLEKGIFYYDQGAYNKAKEYFSQVKQGDPDYESAQKYLKQIEGMSDDEKDGSAPSDEVPKLNPNRNSK